MLSASSLSRAVPLSVEASVLNAVNVLEDEKGLNQSNNDEISDLHKLDKSEINDAVTKVLQGYDWTLVPIASK